MALWPTLVGAALGGTGGAYFIVAGTKTGALAQEGLSEQAVARLRSERRLAENRGIVFSLFGAASLALGGTMYLLAPRETSRPRVGLAPLPGGAAFVLEGKWH